MADLQDELEVTSNHTESSEDEQQDIQPSDSDEETPQLHHTLNHLHAALGPQAPSHPPPIHFPPARRSHAHPIRAYYAPPVQMRVSSAGAAAVLRAVPERSTACRQLAR